VRTVEEFAAGHAPGALNVPIMFSAPGGMAPNPDFLAAATGALGGDKGVATLVACKAGPRASKAASALAQAGYTALTEVTGGWMAWEAAGLPVEK
jgi:rhodanese-related sulfurtransferase